DQDLPWRAIDVRACKDNPVALAEGATGAPRIMPRAMSQTNLLGRFNLSGPSPLDASIITGLDGVRDMRVDLCWFRTGGDSALRFALNRDGAGSTGWINLGGGNNIISNCSLYVNLVTGQWSVMGNTAGAFGTGALAPYNRIYFNIESIGTQNLIGVAHSITGRT
ncbi:hypothetical protein BYZ73_21170, partial [Rhodovulum viride]